jgi:hypothetical protein
LGTARRVRIDVDREDRACTILVLIVLDAFLTKRLRRQ